MRPRKSWVLFVQTTALILQHQIRETDNGMQWRPQFMAHPRNEGVLRSIGLFRSLFGEPQFFVSLAIRDVTDDRGKHDAVAVSPGCQRQLQREDASVLAQTFELAGLTDNLRTPGGAEPLQTGSMRVYIRLRHEDFYRRAENFLLGVMKDCFRAGVPTGDSAVLICKNDRVGSRLNYSSKPQFGSAKFVPLAVATARVTAIAPASNGSRAPVVPA